MNKKIGIVILAALLLSANASFIEHLYNNTHLRGNVKVETNDGVKVGYDGGLRFDNGFLGFDIANIAGNIKAAVRPGGKYGNETQSSVDYAGDIQVSQGNHSANITVNGTAGVDAEWAKEAKDNGGNFSINATLTNENQWTVNAGDRTANGTSGGCLNVSANAEKDGNKITIEKVLSGAGGHEGTLYSGDKTDTFKVVKYGEVKIDKEIYIKNSSEEDGHGFFGDLLPTIAYSGHAKVKRGQDIEWNNDTVSVKAKGAGNFGGVIWYDKADTNGTYVRSIKHAKSAEFVHGGKVKVNGELHDIYGGAGIVSVASSAIMKVDNETHDFRGGFFDTGNLHYVGVDITKPDSDDEIILEKMQKSPEYVMGDIESGDNVNKKHKKVKTISKTDWVAGKGVKVQHNDDGTVDVATHGGAMWETNGFASNSKEPIHETGERTYNSSFTYDKNTMTIKNILMKIGKDPKAIEELRQRFKAQKVTIQ